MSRYRRRSPKQTFGLATVILMIIVGLAVYLFTRQQQLPPYAVWLITLSVITFAWYGLDKGQSKRAGLRVPEIVLHLLALAGGFPGGWLGRALFHHKTRKSAFTVVLVLSTLLHLGLAPILLK
ncbi:MAG TPA: DUF1294 domain-containing protein [Anaerolineae bacterium]|nr:DUF1294 domain-containing protein [Anaerolineae bacterium]